MSYSTQTKLEKKETQKIVLSKRNRNFETLLEKTGRVMARKFDVKVIIRGNQAKTDGKTIWLPSLEDVPEELFLDLNGFLNHEIAHVKFTSFDDLPLCKNAFHRHLLNAVEDSRIEIELPKEYNGTTLSLQRLNRKWRAKMEEHRPQMPWPIRLILCIREIYDDRPVISDEQIQPLVDVVRPYAEKLPLLTSSTELRLATEEIIRVINETRELLAKDYPDLTEEELAKLMELMGDDMPQETPVALNPDRKKNKPQEAKTKQEMFDPATEEKKKGDKTGDESNDDAESEQTEGAESGQNPEDQEGAGGTGGAESDGTEDGDETEGAGGGQENEAEGDNADGQAGLSAEKEGDDDGSGLAPDAEGAADKTTSYDTSGEMSEHQSKLERRHNYAKWTETEIEKNMFEAKESAEYDEHVFSPETYMSKQVEEEVKVQEALNEETKKSFYMNEDSIDEAVSTPFTKEFDTVEDFSGRGSQSDYDEEKALIMKHINPIKQKLERSLKVKENRRWQGQQERGVLNSRDLANVAVNKNYNVPFKVFRKTETSNVAVTLLLDCSGSMSGNKMRVARQTAIALGESLKAINIPFEVLGFNTGDRRELNEVTSKLSSAESKRFNRFDTTLDHFIFKSFDSPSLNGISKAHAGGANADSESIAWAAQRLAMRKEKRKILMVLSDGQPSYGGANHEILAGDLRRIIRILPKSGIEPIGVGILTEYPKEFYPNNVIVHKLDELSKQVVTRIGAMLDSEGLKLGHI